jgi:hypothetical protein
MDIELIKCFLDGIMFFGSLNKIMLDNFGAIPLATFCGSLWHAISGPNICLETFVEVFQLQAH